MQLEFDFMNDCPEIYNKPWIVREFNFVARLCPSDYWTDDELSEFFDYEV